MDPRLASPSMSGESVQNEFHFYEMSLSIPKLTDKEDYLYTIQGYHALSD
jgi:hypothetical protein